MLSLLENVPDQVLAHSRTDGIGSAAADLVQSRLHLRRAGARDAVRAKQHLGKEPSHLGMLNERVARLTELRLGQADLQAQRFAVAQSRSARTTTRSRPRRTGWERACLRSRSGG